MTTTITRPDTDTALATRIRLADGRLFDGTLPVERHRRVHLGLLHADSDGYVELAAGPRIAGRLRVTTRKDPGHFLPGGATATPSWLDALLGLAERHATAGDEVFVAPAVRAGRGASKMHVSHTRWLWIDVDGRDGLPAVRELLRRKPVQLVVESAGSGGVHCYWRLHDPLPADVIERAHERLIYALGYEWRDGRPVPTVADPACKDRSRVMRLAGTRNGKSGRPARIAFADLALQPWTPDALVGDLTDPPIPRPVKRQIGGGGDHDDPYKRIAPVDYFPRLARIDVPAHRLVSCPNPAHDDVTPSCHVGTDAAEGWCCFACGAAGAIYDLASVLHGGPTGRQLRGEQFRRAREHVTRAYGAT
jgi:hypothetical protein